MYLMHYSSKLIVSSSSSGAERDFLRLHLAGLTVPHFDLPDVRISEAVGAPSNAISESTLFLTAQGYSLFVREGNVRIVLITVTKTDVVAFHALQGLDECLTQ